MSDTMFDLEPEEAIVPSCAVCGAKGAPIVVDGTIVRDLGAAAQWALVEISAHLREMHPAAAT